MVYGESNGHVTDDVTWPRKVKAMTPIRLGPNISKIAVYAIYQQSLITAVRSAILATAWFLVIILPLDRTRHTQSW